MFPSKLIHVCTELPKPPCNTEVLYYLRLLACIFRRRPLLCNFCVSFRKLNPLFLFFIRIITMEFCYKEWVGGGQTTSVDWSILIINTHGPRQIGVYPVRHMCIIDPYILVPMQINWVRMDQWAQDVTFLTCLWVALRKVQFFQPLKD